jgi:hypothetical protein
MCAKVYYVNFNIEEINEINFSPKIQKEIDNLAKLTYCLRNQPESVRFKALGIAIKAKGYIYHSDMIKRWKTIHNVMKKIIADNELADFEENYLAPALKILKRQIPALLLREFHNRLSPHIKKRILDMEHDLSQSSGIDKIIDFNISKSGLQQILSLSDTKFAEYEKYYLEPELHKHDISLKQLVKYNRPQLKIDRISYYATQYVDTLAKFNKHKISREALGKETGIDQSTWSRLFYKIAFWDAVKSKLKLKSEEHGNSVKLIEDVISNIYHERKAAETYEGKQKYKARQMHPQPDPDELPDDDVNIEEIISRNQFVKLKTKDKIKEILKLSPNIGMEKLKNLKVHELITIFDNIV